MTVVFIKRLAHNTSLDHPFYATDLSAGLDLSASIDTPVTLAPFKRILIPTGFSYALPAGFEGQIRPRSGLALKQGISVLNTPGTIDADYRGEVKVILINLGEEDFTILPGMRIAQMVIAPVTRVTLHAAEELDKSTRDSFGFGSTGV